MVTIKWDKDPTAPIPDYHDRAGRFRVYRSGNGLWKLQDRQSPNHPEPILWADTMRDAKEAALSVLAREKEQAR